MALRVVRVGDVVAVDSGVVVRVLESVAVVLAVEVTVVTSQERKPPASQTSTSLFRSSAVSSQSDLA